MFWFVSFATCLTAFVHARGNFRTDATLRPAFLDDDDSSDFLGRSSDGFAVKRAQGAEVDDFCFDAIFFEFFSGFQAIANHFGEGN